MFKKMKTTNKKWLAGILAILLFATMFTIMIFAAIGDSGTVDEIAHIPSGYSYDRYGDYRLNPEHPPLAKALAGFPLLFLDLKDIRLDWTWNAIDQWDAGWHMIYGGGTDPAQIIFWARLPMILLTLGLGLLLYFWSKKLYGRKVSLLVLALYAFYPDILGHGHLVTTDIAAAFGFVVSIFAFDLMLEKKTWKYIIFAALAFALAQLLKFSAFLLFFIFLILILFRAKLDKNENTTYWQSLWRYFKMYFWMSILSLIAVWIVYIPFVFHTPAAIEHSVIENNLLPGDARTAIFRNFLHHFEGNAVTRALGHYLMGIMLVIARVAGGNATYIMGRLSDKSISWYFPVAWLIKTPLTVILMLVWSFILLFVFRSKDKKSAWQNWLFLTPVFVYWAFTLKGSLNIGIRHLIPTIPFVLLFIGKSMYRYLGDENFPLTLQGLVISVLVIFMGINTLSYYPQYIAYFNALVPRAERYKYLTDSSLDWGQDLLRLRDYVAENNIDNIKVDYFGGSVPSFYIPESTEWHSSYGPTTGWLAISATYLQSSKLYGPMESKWDYEWLENFKPVDIIGGSILVYHISAEDLAIHPPISPYPINILDTPGSIKDAEGKVGL